uniref:Uncharacterized protein n=1 Tax=Rhizophora mucronata TaxID=61149 RepID=A0A2P2NSC3_RHIMU
MKALVFPSGVFCSDGIMLLICFSEENIQRVLACEDAKYFLAVISNLLRSGDS